MTFTILMLIVGIGIAAWVIAAVDSYDRAEIGMMMVLGYLFFWVPLSLLPVYLIGFHYDTGSGSQVGYVSAVEKTGIFFKTGRAYIKPDLSSTQEDIYCVTDDSVYAQLQAAATNKARVELSHYSYFSAGIANCEGEGAIISGLKTL